MLNCLDKLDLHYSKFIHDYENPSYEQIIYYFGRLYNPDFIITYLVIILMISLYSNRLNDFIKILLTVIICLIVTLSSKKLFGRPRPQINKSVNKTFNLRQHENNNSMPSGDSLQAANFAMILYLYFNIKTSFIFVPFVMFARVYFFCHYIGDTIIGSFLGLLLPYILYKSLSFNIL